ncbi:hypothetical protein N9V19_01635, partial [Opitutales bacterium]|nr:hypothetical protein [Opitutales bacterium]
MSQFLSRLLVVFLVTFVSAKAAEGPSSFFGFTVTPAAESSGLLSADSRAVLISPSFEIAAGIYQISGQQVSRVDATGSVSLPDLPLLLDQPSGALVDGRLYVAGGSTLFVLDLAASGSAWVELASMPLETEGEPALAGLHGILYLAGAGVNGTQTFSYNPSQDRWSELAAAPQDLRGYLGTSCGNDHILYFNANQTDDRILAYHRITDTWFEMGQLPQAILPLAVGSSETEFSLYAAGVTVSGKALLRPTKYGWVDHSVVAVLVLLLVGVGL